MDVIDTSLRSAGSREKLNPKHNQYDEEQVRNSKQKNSNEDWGFKNYKTFFTAVPVETKFLKRNLVVCVF